MKYLAVVGKVQGAPNYQGYFPDLEANIVATGPSAAKVKDRLARSLGEYLHEVPDAPAPKAGSLADLPDDELEGLEGAEAALIEPLELNPVSLEVARAIRASGLTQVELASRMGTGQAAVWRLTDPFYWGHSLDSLRRLAIAMGKGVEVRFTGEAA